MKTKRTAAELEQRRRLGVERVVQGYTHAQVAQFLGVHVASVDHWMSIHRRKGEAGLAAKPRSGRPPKLSPSKQNLVLGWLRKNPRSFGFRTELWTGRRVAQLIKRKFKVHYNHRYICAWLTAKNFSPQKPRTQPRERDESAIAAWRINDWPRIQNGHVAVVPI